MVRKTGRGGTICPRRKMGGGPSRWLRVRLFRFANKLLSFSISQTGQLILTEYILCFMTLGK